MSGKWMVIDGGHRTIASLENFIDAAGKMDCTPDSKLICHADDCLQARYNVNQFQLLTADDVVLLFSKSGCYLQRPWTSSSSALLALCAENSPVTAEFPSQRPMTRSFDVFFDIRLNKRLSKQSWGWWFETPSRSLLRHCNGSDVLCSFSHPSFLIIKTLVICIITYHVDFDRCHRSWDGTCQIRMWFTTSNLQKSYP